MSFLLRIFKSKSKQVNLTICGLDKAGKTTFVNYLIHGEFRETTPTMGVKRESITFPQIDLNIFDLGGQEDFRPIWTEMNEKSDALIYVVDSSDYLRFDETKEIFHNIVQNQINQNIPVLILLHKTDLPNRMSRIDFIKDFGLTNLDLELTWAVFETSAVTGEGIIESLRWFIDTIGE